MRFFNNDMFTEPGDPIKVIYSTKVNEDGTIDLVPSGKEDWQAYIGSFADEADINCIIAKFVNGDMDALNQRNGVFGDFTQMPKTYAEMLQMQINANESFDKLPVEIKQKFNNDVNQFLATAGQEEWFTKLGFNLDDYMEKKEVVADEVKE